MQVNLDCRKPCPQFGNFLIAGEKGTEVCTKVCSENAERGVSMLRYSIGNGKDIAAVKPQLSSERLQKGLAAVQKVAPPVQPFREQRTR